jgi:hypothetical protein
MKQIKTLTPRWSSSATEFDFATATASASLKK